MSNSPRNYEVLHADGHPPIKAWIRGVPVEDKARAQLLRMSQLPFIHKWLAVMPDCHLGKGATIGSVIATKQAIVPAAVGVDLGCGMAAVRTSLTAEDLPDSLKALRVGIEASVPHGRTSKGRSGDKGSWRRGVPTPVEAAWAGIADRFAVLTDKHPAIAQSNHRVHLGTLGSGNHFIELCLDESMCVWVMLHSGSRGVGNRIGSYFIRKAKEEMQRWFVTLPSTDMAYLPEGSRYFDDYVEAVAWAQDFARLNRELMMAAVLRSLQDSELPAFDVDERAVNCHHNYVSRERHYGEDVWVTRKGAVRAGEGEMGIIPGSMGARSFIVRGTGNPESFCSCSHGAGRVMSRTAAKARFTVEDHVAATEGVECKKDASVIDETPMAYKDIDAVMAAQSDLVEIAHTLKQVLCVKG